MKTLGLLGGMSWNSTELYYRWMNQSVAQQLGGLHSAQLLMYSFDFAEIAAQQKAENWAALGAQMIDGAQRLKAAGADALVICTNTMHLFAPKIEAATGLKVLHIGDAVARELTKQHITQAGILGTLYTMRMPFYADYYRAQHGIRLIAPSEGEQQIVSDIIYNELCRGAVQEPSRAQYLAVMAALQSQGAQAIILGCTEIGMLIEPQHFPALLILDSTRLHVEYAVAYALNQL